MPGCALSPVSLFSGRQLNPFHRSQSVEWSLHLNSSLCISLACALTISLCLAKKDYFHQELCVVCVCVCVAFVDDIQGWLFRWAVYLFRVTEFRASYIFIWMFLHNGVKRTPEVLSHSHPLSASPYMLLKSKFNSPCKRKMELSDTEKKIWFLSALPALILIYGWSALFSTPSIYLPRNVRNEYQDPPQAL